MVTFSSILVGFVGVLLGLLASIKDTPVVAKLFKQKEIGILKGYFSASIISGVMLVFFSIVLFLRDFIESLKLLGLLNFSVYNLLVAVWFSLIIYVILSTWRIINIMMHILFSNREDIDKVDSIVMDKNKARELQERFKKP